MKGLHEKKLDVWYGAKILAFAAGLAMESVADPHEEADYDV